MSASHLGPSCWQCPSAILLELARDQVPPAVVGMARMMHGAQTRSWEWSALILHVVIASYARRAVRMTVSLRGATERAWFCLVLTG